MTDCAKRTSNAGGVILKKGTYIYRSHTIRLLTTPFCSFFCFCLIPWFLNGFFLYLVLDSGCHRMNRRYQDDSRTKPEREPALSGRSLDGGGTRIRRSQGGINTGPGQDASAFKTPARQVKDMNRRYSDTNKPAPGRKHRRGRTTTGANYTAPRQE
jgi:hypothetical protein